MKKVSLRFNDILCLVEFVDYTKTHECNIDTENVIIECELSDADLELAINGYKAVVISVEEAGE